MGSFAAVSPARVQLTNSSFRATVHETPFLFVVFERLAGPLSTAHVETPLGKIIPANSGKLLHLTFELFVARLNAYVNDQMFKG